MGKLGRVTLSALALVGACSSASERSTPSAEPKALERVAVEQLAQPVDERFDARGELKSSGRRFVWLELPLGFAERPGASPRSASFEATEMPLVKVRDYLDARLAPAKLEFTRSGVYFRRSRPAHTQLEAALLDVTLIEMDAATKTVRLQIDDLSPPPEPPLSEEAAKEALARERSRIE